MEQQRKTSTDPDFGELERLIGALREQVDGLRTSDLNAEQLQERLSALDKLAGEAAAALDSTTK